MGRCVSHAGIGYPGVISGISRVWEEARPYAVEKRLKKGESFSFQDETATDFVYVRSGTIACMFYEGNGQARTNLICKSGALINETATTAGTFTDSILFVCTAPATLYHFRSELARDRAFTETCPHLLRNMFYSISIKILNFQTLLNAVCTRSRLELVCWYIHAMCRAHQGADEFEPGLSQAEMCSLIGVSKTSMKRSMAWLKDQGIVSCFTRKRLAIDDMKRLEELAMPRE